MNEVFLPSMATNLEKDFDRPKLLMEYLPDRPQEVLNEVFNTLCRCDALKEKLACWLESLDAFQLSSENQQQTRQFVFYKELPSLIQALHDFHSKGQKSPGMDDYRQIIKNFCSKFPRVFTRRELWCFTSAALIHACDFDCQQSPDGVLEWHEQVSSLLEVAYVLTDGMLVESVSCGYKSAF